MLIYIEGCVCVCGGGDGRLFILQLQGKDISLQKEQKANYSAKHKEIIIGLDGVVLVVVVDLAAQNQRHSPGGGSEEAEQGVGFVFPTNIILIA